MIVDQANRNAGLALRRYAIKPTPPKPRIITAPGRRKVERHLHPYLCSAA